MFKTQLAKAALIVAFLCGAGLCYWVFMAVDATAQPGKTLVRLLIVALIAVEAKWCLYDGFMAIDHRQAAEDR